MASSFSITTTTNAITLDGERRALVLFTVSNQTGRSVRVRTDVSPFPPTPADWFAIEGETERLYPPGGAEAVSVRVAAPATAPPGPYAFRLDAVSVDKPDEEWAHGPAVGFEIPVPPPPPPPPPVEESRGYLETVVGALAGALVAGLLSVVVGILVLAVGFKGNLTIVALLFRLYLLGPLTVGCALGGAIGAVAALIVRGIPDPAPWRTGLAFGALATAALTVVQVVLVNVFPPFPPDVPSIVVTVIVTLIVVAVVALPARAYARYRAGGKL